MRLINKFFLTVLASLVFSIAVRAQAVIYVNAGSRANWGENQQLTINKDGNCQYILRDVNGTLKDSSSFTISAELLNSIFQKADAIEFFKLDKEYDKGVADGWGIYVSLNNDGRKHQVNVLNLEQPAIKEFVTFLNNLLAGRNIRIRY